MLSREVMNDVTKDDDVPENKEAEKKVTEEPIKQQPSNLPKVTTPSTNPPSPPEFSSKIISRSRQLSLSNKETGHVKEAAAALTNGYTTATTNTKQLNPTIKPSTTTSTIVKPSSTTTTTIKPSITTNTTIKSSVTTTKPYVNHTTLKTSTTANTISAATISTNKARVSTGGSPSKLPVSKTFSGPPNKVTSSGAKSAIFETQQWSERSRDNSSIKKRPSPDVPSKPRLHSTATSISVMKEFRPEEKPSQANLKPPSAYFEPQMKSTPGKPLVSISTYPSPRDRPTPVKMDFLPQTSAKIEVNGGTVDGHVSKAVLQNELKSTLTRSNLRQRNTVGEVFEGSLPPSASSAPTTTKPSFTTTTIVNTSIPPKASLSSKYSSIGQGMKGESCKENETPECPPAGILKPTSGPPSSIRPLQKTISFGDVTTVGESEPQA